MMTLALAVHGGAGPRRASPGAHEEGIRQALEAGRHVLRAGGSALDAVIAAVAALEDDPSFNAGRGSVLNSAGYVELDAGLMEGSSMRVGAVAAVRDVRNPIRLCKVVLEGPHILFAKDDASRIAAEAGLELIEPGWLITPARQEQWRRGLGGLQLDTGLTGTPDAADAGGDTVGAVALDAAGNLAAATSTGGINGKAPGRIGDAPLPGGGFYADNVWGACSTTGKGETLARALAARRAIEGLERGLSAQEAAQAAIGLLETRIDGGLGGLLLLDRHGALGAAFNTEAMTYAWWSERDGEGIVVG